MGISKDLAWNLYCYYRHLYYARAGVAANVVIFHSFRTQGYAWTWDIGMGNEKHPGISRGGYGGLIMGDPDLLG